MAVESVEADAAAPLLGQLRDDVRRRTSRYLRVPPQQQRAWQTVDRLLAATARLLCSRCRLADLSLETAAADAGVTPQSAYRYFANFDDLVRTSVRRMQAEWNERFLHMMLCRNFADEAAIAHAVVRFIADTYGSQIEASGQLMGDILRHYHDLDYDAAWLLSHAIAGVGPDTLRSRVAEMASGLTALWAVAKLLVLRDAGQLCRPEVQEMMAAIFLASIAAPSERDQIGRSANCHSPSDLSA